MGRNAHAIENHRSKMNGCCQRNANKITLSGTAECVFADETVHPADRYSFAFPSPQAPCGNSCCVDNAHLRTHRLKCAQHQYEHKKNGGHDGSEFSCDRTAIILNR